MTEEPVSSVNLWSALVTLESQNRKDKHGPYPRVTQEFLGELGRCGRFYMSELSIRPSEEGWIISIFGCDMDDCGGIEILIPKDHKEAVKVVRDEIGARTYRHNQHI